MRDLQMSTLFNWTENKILGPTLQKVMCYLNEYLILEDFVHC